MTACEWSAALSFAADANQPVSYNVINSSAIVLVPVPRPVLFREVDRILDSWECNGIRMTEL